MPERQPLRVAIVGAGIGAQHLQGYLQLPDLYEAACLCDLDTQRAENIAQAAGAERTMVCADMASVLGDPAIDIVDICLPANLHTAAVLQALAAGKHVVCEKPLALSLADVDRIAEAAAQAGRQVLPVFQYRYSAGARKLRALVDSGVAGRLFLATAETHWRRGPDYYADSWHGHWATEGGGAILGHAIHIHDMLSQLLGPVTQVQASVATRVNDIEVDDCAAIACTLASGALATSSITLGAGDDNSRLRAYFERATVASGTEHDLSDDWSFAPRTEADEADLRAAIDLPPQRSGYPALFEENAKALAGLGNQAVTLTDARASIELVTAIYLSHRTGTAVKLPLAPDSGLYDGWAP